MKSLMKLGCLAVALGGWALADNTSATPITVVNHSFESPALPDSTSAYVDGPVVDDWDQTGSTGVEYFNGTNWISPAAYHIKQFAYISSGGILGQDTGATLQANTTYTLTAGVGRQTGTSGTVTFALYASALDTPPLVGTPLVAETFDLGDIPDGSWASRSISFDNLVADPTQTLYIQFSHTGSQALIDQVLLEATSEAAAATAIPEPATLAQLALLGLPLLGRRRR